MSESASALSREVRPVWRLLVLIAAILSALVGVVTADHYLAQAAAREVLAPVDRKIDQHLAEMRPLRDRMEEYVREERSARQSMARKLDALCRATPRADCPLGGD